MTSISLSDFRWLSFSSSLSFSIRDGHYGVADCVCSDPEYFPFWFLSVWIGNIVIQIRLIINGDNIQVFSPSFNVPVHTEYKHTINEYIL